MANKKATKVDRNTFEIFVPVLVVGLFGFLAMFGVFGVFEGKVKDVYNHLVPEAKINPQIAIVDIDDPAIQSVGMFPWSRDIHADILMQLKELGAKYLTYDIEFVDRSPVGVTSRERDATIKTKSAELGEVFGALEVNQLKLTEAQDYAQTILGEGIMLTARDNDAMLGRALKIFGKAFSTVNYNLDEGNEDAKNAIQFTRERSFLPQVTGDLAAPSIRQLTSDKILRGAIVPIASGAAFAGITNVGEDKDPDGVLRRITLLFRGEPDQSGKAPIYGQLAFVPVWDRYGRPPIEVHANKIILKTSTLSESPQPDVVIPLDYTGRMIINWPHSKSNMDHYDNGQGFVHVLVSQMMFLKKQEVAVHDFIYNQLRPAGYLGNDDFTTLYDEAQLAYAETVAQGDPALFDGYVAKHEAWIAAFQDFAGGGVEQSILDSLDQSLADPKLSVQDRQQVEDIKALVSPNFQELREAVRVYTENRDILKKRLKDAFCFIGWTSAATTDYGVTPFDSTYPMVGTHAAIANTIFNKAYMNELPPWIAYVVGSVLSLSMIIVGRRFKTFTAAIVGFAVFVGLLVVVGVVFVATGIYIGALLPSLTLLVTVVGLTLVRFFGSEKDKAFLRNSFQSYLSPDVINQLIADPSKLSLGGEKKFMTAMFTDVKGFSTFSEKLDPQDLVALLNRYLTIMSDLILETHGMIDKFEGDAIIANWGAFTMADHAQQAVRTAIMMKRAEVRLNEELKNEGMAPMFTRIGINTGEMTVGNMGTAKRMDFTMMGNAVNLAARLEGVNKQYNTWILMSESTRDQLGEEFLVRRLDRVRVVGISTPVRLYEGVDIMAEAPEQLKQVINTFEKGLDLFETKDWTGSAKAFEEALKMRPDDGPALKYLERAKKYQKEPPAANWDGVFSMTEK